jgi:hypothetical protein
MNQSPFLILDTPRGPDGTCWFVTEPDHRNEGLVARLGTRAREQHKAGRSLLGPDYVAVAQEAIQVRDNGRRPGHELLILAGLNRTAMASEAALREILKQHLSRLNPMSGDTLACDAGSSGIVRSGPAIREIESDVLRQLPNIMQTMKLERKPSWIARAFKQLAKAALVIVLAVIVGVVLVRTLKPRIVAALTSLWSNTEQPSNANRMTPQTKGGDVDFFAKDERWNGLIKAYGLPSPSTPDQRKLFVSNLYRELNPQSQQMDDLTMSNSLSTLPEIERLLASVNPEGETSAKSLSAQLVNTSKEDWRELKSFVRSYPDVPGASGVCHSRAILSAWWLAFREFHEDGPVTFEDEAKRAWEKLQRLEPVKAIPFLTPKDTERLAAISNFLSEAVADDPSARDWKDSDWRARVGMLKSILEKKSTDRPRKSLFLKLVTAVSPD